MVPHYFEVTIISSKQRRQAHILLLQHLEAGRNPHDQQMWQCSPKCPLEINVCWRNGYAKIALTNFSDRFGW